MWNTHMLTEITLITKNKVQVQYKPASFILAHKQHLDEQRPFIDCHNGTNFSAYIGNDQEWQGSEY